MADVVETSRPVLLTAETVKCGQCGAIATHSCTDAREIENDWLETEARHGCATHPVESMIYFLDGSTMTAAQFQRQATSPCP